MQFSNMAVNDLLGQRGGVDADHFMVDVKKTLEQGDWDELDSLMR